MTEWISKLIALCGSGLAIAGNEPLALPATLLAAGLAGGVLHCSGMCGPFVLGQVMSADSAGSRHYGEWHRLGAAALAPYHLGRATTYVALGALSGGATALFASTTGFAWLSSLLLISAALLLIAQAAGLVVGRTTPWSATLSRLAAPLSRSHRPSSRYGMGVLLGFLPCGLLYGALAAAAGSASMIYGALGMLAFALGTMPTLVAVGWGGLLLRRRLREAGRWIAAPILLANAVLMLTLASQRI